MKDVRSFWPVEDHTFRWYIGLFKKTSMIVHGTLKPSVLSGQRLDVEFTFKMAVMAVTLWTVLNWDNGRAGELKIY